MTNESDDSGKVQAAAEQPTGRPAPTVPPSVWARIRDHKVVQWTLAYVAAAYTLLHAVEMVGDALDWPHLIVRVVTLLLFLGLPVATTLAWYHGHRAQHRVSGPELAILTVLLVIAGGVLAFLGRPSQERAPAKTAQSIPATTGPKLGNTVISEKSIAVLPFADMSEKKDQEYFADGMAEEILDLLVKIPQLNVIGRTSSFQFKGHNEDLRAIGAKLGAAYIVEGSVRKAGTRIRVTAQLIDASSGVHRWAESYDRDFGDILTLQDQIATSIARALQIAVGADDTRLVRRLESTEAYTLYLHGLSELDQEHSVSLAQAKNDFEQALTMDPSFLRAAEALALTHIAMALDQDVPPDTAWQHAKEAADRALRIDRNSATAHGVLGLEHAESEFDWAAAEEEFSKALALNPHDPVTLNFGARVAHARGRHDEALQRINASLSRDPLNPYAQQTLGWILYGSGDFAGAELALRKSLAISPTFDGSHLVLGQILLVHGQREAALREMQAEVDDESRDVGLAMVYHALGRHAESSAALARLIRSASDRWPFGAAWVHAYRGERDEAFEWLEKDYVVRDPDLPMFIRSPMFASLRDDPRYEALLRKMNLSE